MSIAADDVRIIPEELTASAYITTDEADNQITGFNPGAMKHPSKCAFDNLDPSQSIAIVAPGNLQDMAEYSRMPAVNGASSGYSTPGSRCRHGMAVTLPGPSTRQTC